MFALKSTRILAVSSLAIAGMYMLYQRYVAGSKQLKRKKKTVRLTSYLEDLRALCADCNDTIQFSEDSEWKVTGSKSFSSLVVQGGITNQLYRCTVGDKSVLVRVYGAKSEMLINRSTDEIVSCQLGDIGFAPYIYALFDNGRIEQWLPGANLTPDLFLKSDIQVKIAHKLAIMHKLEINCLPKRVSLWSTLDKWATVAETITFDEHTETIKYDLLKKLKIADVVSELKSLVSKLKLIDSPLVFAHNDLLSGNVMYDTADESVRFVDFEYGSYNPRGFDIGNHFCECCGFDCNWDAFPTKQQQKHFLIAYLHEYLHIDDKIKPADIENLYEEIRPFVLASHMFWFFWAIVQSKVSLSDFDYLIYAGKRLDGYYTMKDRALLKKIKSRGNSPNNKSRPQKK